MSDLDARADDEASKLGDVAAAAGIGRVHFLAWRDLDDPEAGGSEVHAHEIARRWARAGIEVSFRTSYAPGLSQVAWRDGYRVIRKAGRYLVFPRAAISEVMGWHGERDALVEIWNGMPFFSPLWAHGPRVVFLHHVHAEMWDMSLPPNLARLGRTIESTVAPLIYRRTRMITLSQSSKRELVDDLGFHADRVSVVEPGIDPRFCEGGSVGGSPGGTRSGSSFDDPLVVAVGRLVPVKRFSLFIEALAELKLRHPRLRAVIVGEGYERAALEARIAENDAETWIELPGRLDDDALVDLYRRAWVLASTSAREGWGMTITEAAACGTPAVVTDIAGHRDAVESGVTGLLGATQTDIVAGIDVVLTDEHLRHRMSEAAAARAARYTWDATARGVLDVLAGEAQRSRAR